MKNKSIFNKIFIIISLLLFISILTLIILGNISRKGYLSEFQLDESLSTQGNYLYNFRIKYYNKIFRNSDIYEVYIDIDKAIKDNNFIKEIKFNEKGSPFGVLISSKELNPNDKIDNVNYKLKIKLSTLILFILSILLLYLFTVLVVKIISNIPLLFVLLLSFTILLFFIFFIKDKGGMQLNIVAGGWDLFADFYNMIIYVSERDPFYHPLNGLFVKCYLPLAYMFFYPFSVVKNYYSMSLYEVQIDPISNMSLLIFMFIGILLFILSLKKLYNKKEYSYIIPALLFITTPLIYTIERGNIILHTAAFASIFLCLYKSEKRHEQIIALICLGIASALKIYPVILGFLLLQEKRYKDIIIGALITLVLVFLPFFFLKHSFLENFSQFLLALKEFSNIMGIRYGLALLFISKLGSDFLLYAKIIVFIFFIISIIYSFVANEYWKKVLLLMIISIQTPTTAYYAELFMYPVIILFLSKEKFYKIDYVFLILFVLLLMPLQILQIPIYSYPILGSFLSAAIWLIVLIETILTRSNILFYKIKNFKIY